MENTKKVIYEVFECGNNSEIYFNEENGCMTVDFVSQGILCMTLDIAQIIDKCKKWAINKGYILNYSINVNQKTFTYIINVINIKSKFTKTFDKELSILEHDMEYKFIFLALSYIINNEA